MKESFQGGVDSIYNALISAGFTPTDKTPSAIVDAISGIKKSTTISVQYGTSDAGHGVCTIYSSSGSTLFDGYNKDGGWDGRKIVNITVPF